jgi:hypothetical protein
MPRRLKAKEAAKLAEDGLKKKRSGSSVRPSRPTVPVSVDGATYNLVQRRTKNVSVDTKNWGRLTFALDERYRKIE